MELMLGGSSAGVSTVNNMKTPNYDRLQRHSLALVTSSSSMRLVGGTATTVLHFRPRAVCVVPLSSSPSSSSYLQPLTLNPKPRASCSFRNRLYRSFASCFSSSQSASVESGPATNGIDTGATLKANPEKEESEELQVARGYTMTQLCDRMIDVFLNEKSKPKDWRKLLVFRDDWKKYSYHFYDRCQVRANAEHDLSVKQKLLTLARRLKKVDDEMEKHSDLLKEIQQNPTDLNVVVAKRRNDFTGDFFRYLNILSEVNDSLEERDAMSRLGAKCLCAVCAYDNAANNLEMLESAQSKFDDILDSHSLDAACEKINSLAKAKKLDSSLILLINRAWAAAKESTSMKREAKDIMYSIYKVAKGCIRDSAPKEIKLLKQLLNITDPEERFSALATAFTHGSEHEIQENAAIHTTPKELHKWIKIMLDAYNLNKEESDMRESRDLASPVVLQRLSILMETIEEEYMKQYTESKGLENPP